MRQADGVRPAPRHKRELNNRVKLLAHVVFGLPVAVQAEGFTAGLVKAQHVGLNPVTEVQVRVHLKDGAEPVLVVRGVLAAFNFVVSHG